MKPKIDMDTFLYNASLRGFALISTSGYHGDEIPVEELIIHISANPIWLVSLFKGVPVIVKNSQIDYSKLRNLAIEKHVQNILGYLLDVTQTIFQSFGEQKDLKNISETIALLIERKEAKTIYLDEESSRNPAYLRLAIKRQCPLLKKWNILGLSYVDGFIDVYKTYEGTNKRRIE
jgi:hypothetical protein